MIIGAAFVMIIMVEMDSISTREVNVLYSEICLLELRPHIHSLWILIIVYSLDYFSKKNFGEKRLSQYSWFVLI